jgi:transcriptional regulator with XRE-family HTH domain
MLSTLWTDIIEELIARREALGISQLELDERLGNASGLVSKWECGMRRPTGFNLACWMQALGVVRCPLVYSSDPIPRLSPAA